MTPRVAHRCGVSKRMATRFRMNRVCHRCGDRYEEVALPPLCAMNADNLARLLRIPYHQEVYMNRPVPVMVLTLLVLATAIVVACGSSSRMLQSITMNPQAADANGSPVPFIATGNYDAPPRQVTPQPATWGACMQNIPTNDVSVTANGMAQCGPGAVGTYTVFAYVNLGSGSCKQTGPVSQCGVGPCVVTGTAQLTCP
jgi:hypothetical protein